MSRYPSTDGLARPVTELGFEVVEFERRKTNNHHLYFYKAFYNKPHERFFRGLIPHVQTMWIPEHNELHERFSPPIMPSEALMIQVLDEYIALNGVLDVVRESNTSQTYQVSQEQYERIRDGRPFSGR